MPLFRYAADISPLRLLLMLLPADVATLPPPYDAILPCARQRFDNMLPMFAVHFDTFRHAAIDACCQRQSAITF